MTPKLLRTQAEVDTADMADLLHTFNALRGEHLASFPSLPIARTRVRMAILAAESESGKAGVAPNTRPVAKTVEELGHNPYKEGSMSHALYEAVHKQDPIAPRPRKEDLPKEQQAARVVIQRVRATGAGTSKVQPSSVRGAVLKFITDAAAEGCTVEALEAHFQQPVRGYLQKLLEKNHITVANDKTT